ncbi:MAG: hypothetical protein SWH78_10450 [Thermodesulfobacteriota bacterium]|nr:hypothetical protein [Thermodesulfobacteriota bacterium]
MVMSLLPATHYHLIVTHGPWGEYTRHRRHEETSRAVAALWNKGSVSATEVWMFAYEDGGKQYLPRPVETAHRSLEIPDKVWRQKYRIITQVYGFASDSFEAKAAPHKEAFWRFISQSALRDWSMKKGVSNEDSCSL